MPVYNVASEMQLRTSFEMRPPKNLLIRVFNWIMKEAAWMYPFYVNRICVANQDLIGFKQETTIIYTKEGPLQM